MAAGSLLPSKSDTGFLWPLLSWRCTWKGLVGELQLSWVDVVQDPPQNLRRRGQLSSGSWRAYWTTLSTERCWRLEVSEYTESLNDILMHVN